MEITAQDFEYLFETAMEWDAADWKDQATRFDFETETNKGMIYWVSSYAFLILCREFLKMQGQTFVPTFDEALQQWCFVSDYNFWSARVSA